MYEKLVDLLQRDSELNFAYEMCVAAHESIGQKRKYTGEPYWHHPFRVASLLVNHSLVCTKSAIVAALSHDEAEDVFPKNPNYSFSLLEKHFGVYATSLVRELTDVYTKEAFPDKNRKQRHNMESNRLSWISTEAQTIKYCDILDNVRDIKINDPKFAPNYISEKKDVLRLMKYGDATLYKMACEEVGL